MAEPWFYMPMIPPPGEVVEFDDAEAHHALRARRLQGGDRITLFNGEGLIAAAELVPGHVRSRATARIIDHTVAQRLRPSVELASALPSGDRLADMVNMATQLGMAAFRPLAAQRQVAKPSAGFRQRFRRICLEACKQSRRAYLPELREACAPVVLATSAASASQESRLVLMAHPGGEPLTRCLLDQRAAIVLMIGPEGGFTDEETHAVSAAGGRLVELGGHPLRIETAAVAALSLIMLR